MRSILLASLFLAEPATAMVVQFDFLSGEPVVVSAEAQGFNTPIYATIVLDLPELRNLDYRAEFYNPASGPTLFNQSSPYLVSANIFGQDFWSGFPLWGSFGMKTDSTGKLTHASVVSFSDTPDLSIGFTGAQWGSSSEVWYVADGFWSTTILEPAPVPIPAPIASLAAGLGLFAFIGRKRPQSAA